MARQARMIIPGVPHHVTQRGNRRERIFLEPGDEAIYLELMRTRLERHGVACWAYCLMPNHVHFILTPTDETGLARAIGEAHRRYAAFVGARGGWTGHLFQARFGSAAMDEDHLMAAFRYVANPSSVSENSILYDYAYGNQNAFNQASAQAETFAEGFAMFEMGDVSLKTLMLSIDQFFNSQPATYVQFVLHKQGYWYLYCLFSSTGLDLTV